MFTRYLRPWELLALVLLFAALVWLARTEPVLLDEEDCAAAHLPVDCWNQR